AGGIAIAGLADVGQQFAVTRAPIESESFFEALRRAAVAAGNTTVGIVDHAPGAKAVVAVVGAQHAEPVDQDADALLEHVGVEARVAGGGLVPDLPAGAFGRAEAGFAVVEAGACVRRRSPGSGDCGGGRGRRLRRGRDGRVRGRRSLAMASEGEG